MKRIGLAIPTSRAITIGDQLALAWEGETRGYESVWVPEAAGPDAVSLLAFIAGRTERVRVASGIVPVQTRSPIVLGMTAATLGHLAPGRVALGLGVSSNMIVQGWHGLDYWRPLQRLREAVQVIRMVLSGESVNFDGEFYRIRNFRLAGGPPPAPVPIFLAALGPRMLELAGEIADGVLLNWIAAERIADCLRYVDAGAWRAGRKRADVEIAVYVRTCVTDAPEEARQWLAREITGYVIVDAYASFFRNAGFGPEVDAVNAAWKAGDRAGAVRKISPRFLDALGLVGPAELCCERLQTFVRAGVTLPVVFPFSPDRDPYASVLATLRTFP